MHSKLNRGTMERHLKININLVIWFANNDDFFDIMIGEGQKFRKASIDVSRMSSHHTGQENFIKT